MGPALVGRIFSSTFPQKNDICCLSLEPVGPYMCQPVDDVRVFDVLLADVAFFIRRGITTTWSGDAVCRVVEVILPRLYAGYRAI